VEYDEDSEDSKPSIASVVFAWQAGRKMR